MCVMWDRVATEDGWPIAVHTCKEDMKNMRLDEDKRWDLKEKKTSCQVKGSAIFGGKNELVG